MTRQALRGSSPNPTAHFSRERETKTREREAPAELDIPSKARPPVVCTEERGEIAMSRSAVPTVEGVSTKEQLTEKITEVIDQKETMMKQSKMKVSLAVALLMGVTGVTGAAAASFPTFPVRRCAPDAVLAGTVCLDRYEASVWRVPNPTTTNASLVREIRLGRATQADLVAGGAIQLGTRQGVDYAPCADNGQNCADDIYAVSLPSATPSWSITWFQAQEACANSAKRLPTNAEWQVGANGTPDPGPDNGTTDCNSATGEVSLTGARSSCVSARGAFDMVGNLAEWVADWVPLSTACPGWAGFSDDAMCLAGASEVVTGPGALLRGGSFLFSFGGASAGPLHVHGGFAPSSSRSFGGFRCAR